MLFALLLLASAPAEARFADFEQKILAIHNRERAAVGTAPLRWDPKLASDAAAWGNRMTGTGELTHADENENKGQGENLWMGTRGYYSLETMVEDWAEEKAAFKGGGYYHVESEDPADDIGHYTQMVWRDTERVGCAIARDREWDYFVCRYEGPGNWIGQAPY